MPDNATGEPVELSVIQHGSGVVVVAVAVELDMVTTPAFQQLLTQELANGGKALIVDLNECAFMGSSGLAVLLDARERALGAGTALVLAGLTESVARSLQVTALDRMFTIYPTVQDAVSKLTTE